MKHTSKDEFAAALQQDASLFGVALSSDEILHLTSYYELLLHWNPRLHLVAPCSPAEFATRHVLESLLLLRYLKAGARVADVGSGGGLPIIPCLLARPDIRATLIESSPKKSVFLREALRSLKLDDRANVISNRFEQMPSPDANAITCRALERFQELLPQLIEWAPLNSTLFLFAGDSILSSIKAAALPFETVPVPGSERRQLIILPRA
jgi:16S rRNA (guanine527-N7)-methyltransferase